MAKNLIDEFWDEFLRVSSKDMDTKYSGHYHMGNDNAGSMSLLAKVWDGKKHTKVSSMELVKLGLEKLPKVGDYYILTNLKGSPYLVVQTTEVNVKPFKEMTCELCREENLDSWKNSHEEYFKAEGSQKGYEFTEDMEVIVEVFEIVYRKSFPVV